MVVHCFTLSEPQQRKKMTRPQNYSCIHTTIYEVLKNGATKEEAAAASGTTCLQEIEPSPNSRSIFGTKCGMEGDRQQSKTEKDEKKRVYPAPN
ncbi:hypothetical protein PoB_002299000 [Plakobranchus ocellatus]|uniref:Mos1 transposase HTH domain-containing protein n=1 Tax=Plakobranchus ocellatus TaxID=259542 RepID=A0AAV3ZLD7_9GAST|nr:hypothetical protein PoB_002299000 [Plakobranchus ocellatus]